MSFPVLDELIMDYLISQAERYATDLFDDEEWFEYVILQKIDGFFDYYYENKPEENEIDNGWTIIFDIMKTVNKYYEEEGLPTMNWKKMDYDTIVINYAYVYVRTIDREYLIRELKASKEEPTCEDCELPPTT